MVQTWWQRHWRRRSKEHVRHYITSQAWSDEITFFGRKGEIVGVRPMRATHEAYYSPFKRSRIDVRKRDSNLECSATRSPSLTMIWRNSLKRIWRLNCLLKDLISTTNNHSQNHRENLRKGRIKRDSFVLVFSLSRQKRWFREPMKDQVWVFDLLGGESVHCCSGGLSS